MSGRNDTNQCQGTLFGQADAILLELKTGREITPMDALRKFGCLRLGARIYDLRKAGHNISSHMVETANGKRVASYRLEC